LNTPQHDLAAQYRDEMQAIGEFVEWLSYDKRLTLCQLTSVGRDLAGHEVEQFVPASYDIQRLLAEFYSIDYGAYLAEKETVLKHLRQLQAEVSALQDGATITIPPIQPTSSTKGGGS
jgi:hypothetical protein